MTITTQAIETKFIRATNVTGERIKATAWVEASPLVMTML